MKLFQFYHNFLFSPMFFSYIPKLVVTALWFPTTRVIIFLKAEICEVDVKWYKETVGWAEFSL